MMGHGWKPWERARKNGLTGKGVREYAAVVMSGAGDVCMSVEDVEGSDELRVTESGRKRNCVGGQKGKVDQELFLKTRANINDHQHDNNKHKPDMVIPVTHVTGTPHASLCPRCRECCSQRVTDRFNCCPLQRTFPTTFH
jgi:hypothetical protein